MNWPSTFALRRRRAARLATGPLRDFYASPPPAPATPLDELDLVAIDVETTGLDPARDTVLSVGHVLVQGLSIALGTASGHLVDAGVAVGQSATFHGITDDALARAIDGRFRRSAGRHRGRLGGAGVRDGGAGVLQLFARHRADRHHGARSCSGRGRLAAVARRRPALEPAHRRGL